MSSTESSLEYCCVSRWFAAGQLYAAATVTRLLADGPLRKGGGSGREQARGTCRRRFVIVDICRAEPYYGARSGCGKGELQQTPPYGLQKHGDYRGHREYNGL